MSTCFNLVLTGGESRAHLSEIGVGLLSHLSAAEIKDFEHAGSKGTPSGHKGSLQDDEAEVVIACYAHAKRDLELATASYFNQVDKGGLVKCEIKKGPEIDSRPPVEAAESPGLSA